MTDWHEIAASMAADFEAAAAMILDHDDSRRVGKLADHWRRQVLVGELTDGHPPELADDPWADDLTEPMFSAETPAAGERGLAALAAVARRPS